MAAPNIVTVTQIIGRTEANTVPTVATGMFLENPSSSNQVYKINTVMVTNINTAPISCTLAYYAGSTQYFLAANIVVPVGSTVVLLARDTQLYLEENQSLRSIATNGGLFITGSYEVIS